MTCPSCGAGAPKAARFCPECGQPLVVRPDERRLVTVLMADIVGFTALSEAADPEHVKNLVDLCFERLVADITAFGGMLDKIVGDQVVAQFGAPVTHEDDAERAVRAALQMQQSVAGLGRDLVTPVALRIGINTGEVLVGALRAGGDSTVMGDVVNIASRLQTLAPPGQVVVGPATYAATRGCVRYEPLGPLEVRGREEAVKAWVALEAIGQPGTRRMVRPAPLVGRDAEMATLRHAVHIAATRGRAQLMLLFGEAGVGKSRLATELVGEARANHGARVLVGQCVPYGDTNVWAPVADALRQACGLDTIAPHEETRARVAAAVGAALGRDPHDHECKRIAEGLLYFMEGVARPAVDPARARDDALRSVLAFLEGIARHAPLVLVLSHLHWADDVVLDLLDRLLARLWNAPFAVVGTARPGFEERWQPAPGRHNSLVLHLDPLDPEATAQLVIALLGESVDPDVADFLRDRSGGNPFFVEELVALLRESEDGGGPGLRPERVRELPATLHGLVAARLDALEPDERSVLEDCAVVGPSGTTAAVLALSSVPDARGTLQRLADRDLIVLDGDDFRFKSALIRDVAYGTLTKAERARRHAALAPLLAASGDGAIDQVAHHLTTAAELVGELGPVTGVPTNVREQAVVALGRAARRADDIESWIVAERLHDRALSLVDTDYLPARWPSLLGRARARNEQHEIDRARDDVLVVLEEARELRDRPTEAEALLLLGSVQHNAAEYDEAEVTFAEAAQLMREVENPSGVASALRGLGLTHLFRGENGEAEHLFSEALAAYRSNGDRRGEAWALQNLAWISFARGNTEESEGRLHRSADLFAEVGDWGGLGWALGLLAFVHLNQGRFDEAEELGAQIAIEGRETGNRWAVGMMEGLLANINLWRGRGEECVRHGREALETFRLIGDDWGAAQAAAPLARALAGLGRWAEYEVLYAELELTSGQLADRGMHLIPPFIAAAVDLQRGNPEDALERLMAAIAEAGNVEAPGAHDRLGALGLALLQTGRVDEAITRLAPAYRDATTDGPAAALGGLLGLAHAAAGRPEEALRLADELDRIVGATYMDRILARWTRGFAALQQGVTDEAVAAFDEAHALAAGTDSRVDLAVATLARARALETLAVPEAATALVQAADQLDALGIAAGGWETLFALATGRSRHDVRR